MDSGAVLQFDDADLTFDQLRERAMRGAHGRVARLRLIDEALRQGDRLLLQWAVRIFELTDATSLDDNPIRVGAVCCAEHPEYALDGGKYCPDCSRLIPDTWASEHERIFVRHGLPPWLAQYTYHSSTPGGAV